jgi:uncharacterized protein (TIGR00251 family)
MVRTRRMSALSISPLQIEIVGPREVHTWPARLRFQRREQAGSKARLPAMDPVSTRLRLRVSPGASRAAVVGRYGQAWKVRVAAPPEGGRANDAVLRLLAETLSVPRDAVKLVSGQAARDKVVELAGIDETLVERRLSSAAGKEQAA